MITASIVLYNTNKNHLKNVIASYCPSDNRRLYLIDNSEKKSSYVMQYAMKKNISYIHNDKNLGYGVAHNIGIKKAIQEKSDYHLVLNPDLLFDPNVIDCLIEYANKHLDVVYMLPNVVYPDGKIQYLCKLLPTPWNLFLRRFMPDMKIAKEMDDKYVLKISGYNHIMNPPCLSGCFMFMRTNALLEHQILFDERFFMYFEDFDLIRRLHRVGKTIFFPGVTIVHNHEKKSYSDSKMMIEHMKSACKYFSKYGWIVDKERDDMNKKILEEITSLNIE